MLFNCVKLFSPFPKRKRKNDGPGNSSEDGVRRRASRRPMDHREAQAQAQEGEKRQCPTLGGAVGSGGGGRRRRLLPGTAVPEAADHRGDGVDWLRQHHLHRAQQCKRKRDG